MMKQQKKAFTLVELIVVIVILAILWTIAFIAMQWYSRDSRDSVRISDISTMKTTLELYNLEAWKYPLPDSADEVTYSWWVLRYQWQFWAQVVTNVSRNLSEIPTDPLMDKQYFYSVMNTRSEFQLLTLLEWEFTSMFNNTTFAANLDVTPRLDGNYNGLFVSTNNYLIPTPSLITSEDTAGGMILTDSNITSQVIDGWDNIPQIWNIDSSTGSLSGLSLSVYTWTINEDSTDEEKIAAIEAIQWAYTGSILANDNIYQDVLSKSQDNEKLVLWDLYLIDTVSDLQPPTTYSEWLWTFISTDFTHTNTHLNTSNIELIQWATSPSYGTIWSANEWDNLFVCTWCDGMYNKTNIIYDDHYDRPNFYLWNYGESMNAFCKWKWWESFHSWTTWNNKSYRYIAYNWRNFAAYSTSNAVYTTVVCQTNWYLTSWDILLTNEITTTKDYNNLVLNYSETLNGGSITPKLIVNSVEQSLINKELDWTFPSWSSIQIKFIFSWSTGASPQLNNSISLTGNLN